MSKCIQVWGCNFFPNLIPSNSFYIKRILSQLQWTIKGTQERHCNNAFNKIGLLGLLTVEKNDYFIPNLNIIIEPLHCRKDIRRLDDDIKIFSCCCRSSALFFYSPLFFHLKMTNICSFLYSYSFVVSSEKYSLKIFRNSV